MTCFNPTMVIPSLRGAVVAKGYGYWASKFEDGRLPGRRALDPLEIPDLLPQIALLDISREPWDFRFRLVGTGLVSHLGGDLTGQWMSAIPGLKPPSALFDDCHQVASTAEPSSSLRPYGGPANELFDAEDMILPLASDGRTPDMLLMFVEYVPKAPALPDETSPA